MSKRHPSPPGTIIYQDTEHRAIALTVQFNEGDDILLAEYEYYFGDPYWTLVPESGVYLSYEAFDRLVEAVRKQRAKENNRGW